MKRKEFDMFIEPATRYNGVRYLLRETNGIVWEPHVWLIRKTATPGCEIGLRTAQKGRRSFINHMKEGGLKVKEVRSLFEYTDQYFCKRLVPMFNRRFEGLSDLGEHMDACEYFFFTIINPSAGIDRHYYTRDELGDMSISTLKELMPHGLFPARIDHSYLYV